MQLKPGVSLLGVQPSTVAAMVVVDGVYQRELGHELTVTSVCDHDPDRLEESLHGEGLAFDCRTWDKARPRGTQLHEDIKRGLVEAIRQQLGPGWDVVLKPDHIHVEHDDAKA